jgi:hypothetical protein
VRAEVPITWVTDGPASAVRMYRLCCTQHQWLRAGRVYPLCNHSFARQLQGIQSRLWIKKQAGTTPAP